MCGARYSEPLLRESASGPTGGFLSSEVSNIASYFPYNFWQGRTTGAYIVVGSAILGIKGLRPT